MEIIKTASAGTVESSDIIVTIEPAEQEGVEVVLTSSVMAQYGKQIEKVIRDTLSDLGVENARVEAVDKGALDCTVRARTAAAAYRAAESTDYTWRTKA
ncbi:MAG: citrate lyase acyl carrier protein [Clostridia bacterium]|nr:citrate lyase acyl carrier protein [Clostridia bacterium]MBR0444783.1 citrate lyase acyl carrier protein [Clostridia bacterium]